MTEKNILKNEKTLMIIIAVLVILFAILLSFPNITNPIRNIMNKEGVYSVEIIRINGCEDCFNLDSLSSSFSKMDNVKIKNEKEVDYNSQDGRELLNKYSIKTVPALIILSNKLDKLELSDALFRKVNNAAIFDKSVPYIGLDSNDIVGMVNLIEIYDSSCTECAALGDIKEQFKSLGIKVKNYDMVNSISEKGKELISKNGVSYTPSLLISKDIKEYWWLFDSLKGYLTEYDNWYRFSQPAFPYKEISGGKIKGKVEITYITNKSCEDCFNATQLKEFFGSAGIYIAKEENIDISSGEGKNLVARYNITAVPTGVLSKEITDYTHLKDNLEKIGTFEKDGSFVFRKLDIIGAKYQEIKR